MFNILSLFKNKIIIGIHGLNNKPPENLLKKWWKLSIKEGIKNIGKNVWFFNFELAYWSDYFYYSSEDPFVEDPKHPLYLDNPYVPGSDNNLVVNTMPKESDKKFRFFLEKKFNEMVLDDNSIINLDFISDIIIKNIYRDLFLYYQGKCPIKQKSDLPAKIVLRNFLAQILRKYKNKEILLIGHSMGSIIAYDTLMQTAPEVDINTFVTIGSPIGLPVIKKRIMRELRIDSKNENELPTPDNIKKNWLNYYDITDKTTLDHNLSVDFKKNKNNIKPTDIIVNNNYEYNGIKNPHKSYGYLRVPELAEVIYDFLKK